MEMWRICLVELSLQAVLTSIYELSFETDKYFALEYRYCLHSIYFINSFSPYFKSF